MYEVVLILGFRAFFMQFKWKLRFCLFILSCMHVFSGFCFWVQVECRHTRQILAHQWCSVWTFTQASDTVSLILSSLDHGSGLGLWRPIIVHDWVGGLSFKDLSSVHHWGLNSRPQVRFKVAKLGFISALQSLLSNHIQISTRPIRHIIKNTGLFCRSYWNVRWASSNLQAAP